MRLLTSSRGPVVPFALTAANLLANARTWSSKRHHQKYEIVEDRKLAYQIVRLMAEEPPIQLLRCEVDGSSCAMRE